MSNVHTIIPTLFPEPAAAPLRDAFTTVASIVAVTLLAKKNVESWAIWITVDLIALVYYFQVGIILVGIEYIVFAILATFGLIKWIKERKGYHA